MDDGACETYDTSSPSSTFMSYGQCIYGRIVTAGGASITIGLALAWRRPDGGLDRTRAYGSADAVGEQIFVVCFLRGGGGRGGGGPLRVGRNRFVIYIDLVDAEER